MLACSGSLTLGLAGYIGGSVLDRLLVHPDRVRFNLTLILRSRDKARKLEEQFGLKTIIGSLDDTQLLEDTAADADVVINTVFDITTCAVQKRSV
jgi:uncharacterized protein YbjT (DUF2867 family)